MNNKLGEFDTRKLEQARKLVLEVHEYNWFPSTSLTKKLETILRKIDIVLATEKKQ